SFATYLRFVVQPMTRIRNVDTVCLGVVALRVLTAVTACTGEQEAPPRSAGKAPPAPGAAPSAAEAEAEAPIPTTASPYDALPEGVRAIVDKPFTGDFDEMVKRRAIRVAVTFNRTQYFIDKAQE